MNNFLPPSTNWPLGSPVQLRTLVRHWLLIAGSAVAAVSLGGAYIAVTPTTYRASAKLIVRQGGLSFNPQEQENRNHREFLATQAEIMQSSVVVNAALNPGEPNDAAASTPEAAAALKRLHVAPLAHTDVLTVFFEDTDSKLAVQRLNAILDQYRQYANRHERTSSNQTLKTLTRREQELREELRRLQSEYEQLRENGPVVGQGHDTLTVDMTRLKELAGRIVEYRQLYAEAQGRLSALDAGAGLNQVSQGPGDEARGEVGVWQNLLEVQRQLREARVRAEELSRTLGPKHRDRIAAEQQVAAWNKALDEERTASLERLKNVTRIYKSSEQQLTELYEQERENVKLLDGYLLREHQLLSNMQRVEQIHQAVLTQLSDLQVAESALSEGLATIDIQVLEQPGQEGARVWPMPVPLLSLCALLGLIGGGGFVTLREHLQQVGPRTENG